MSLTNLQDGKFDSLTIASLRRSKHSATNTARRDSALSDDEVGAIPMELPQSGAGGTTTYRQASVAWARGQFAGAERTEPAELSCVKSTAVTVLEPIDTGGALRG